MERSKKGKGEVFKENRKTARSLDKETNKYENEIKELGREMNEEWKNVEENEWEI